MVLLADSSAAVRAQRAAGRRIRRRSGLDAGKTFIRAEDAGDTAAADATVNGGLNRQGAALAGTTGWRHTPGDGEQRYLAIREAMRQGRLSHRRQRVIRKCGTLPCQQHHATQKAVS